MLKINSLDEIEPEPNYVTLGECFRDLIEMVDKKFKHIDLCPTKKNKTSYCLHKKSCVHNLIMNFVKGFLKFFSVQAAINLLVFFMNFFRKKVPFQLIIGQIFRKNTLRMGLFLALYNAVVRFITCSSRFWFERNSGLIDGIAGFTAGLITYPLFNKKMNATFGYFIFSRIIDILL